MDINHFKTLKRTELLTDELLEQLKSELTDEEYNTIKEYTPSEEFTRLMTLCHTGGNTQEEIELIEASINLALEFDLIDEDEHDDLLDEFEGCFGLRIVEHDGLQMVAMAVPFWNGKETMRSDGCIYTHGGCWLNVFTGEQTFERD